MNENANVFIYVTGHGVEETAKHTSVGQALPAEETEKDTKMRFGSYADAVRFRKD